MPKELLSRTQPYTYTYTIDNLVQALREMEVQLNINEETINYYISLLERDGGEMVKECIFDVDA
jgi:predicted transcriptional regulator